MIELAPHHKIGLPLAAPVIPAAGFWGYGQNRYAPLIDAARFGAIVTNPITLRPQKSMPAAVSEVSGGVILHAPPGNFGVKKIIRSNRKFWRHSPVPVIAHLPADTPADLRRTVRALASTEIIAGLEIGFTRADTPADIQAIIRSATESELPVLAKLPADAGADTFSAALDTGADALVLAFSPPASVLVGENMRHGDFLGWGIAPVALPRIAAVRQLFPDVPLIAGSGIHSPADAQSYLRAGATAIQLDTIIFINPIQVQQILEETQ